MIEKSDFFQDQIKQCRSIAATANNKAFVRGFARIAGALSRREGEKWTDRLFDIPLFDAERTSVQ
jgi:hypothetical protein